MEKRIANNHVIEDCADFILENKIEKIVENNFDESEYDIRNIRSYLAGLSEDEVRDIVYNSYKDYGKNAHISINLSKCEHYFYINITSILYFRIT